MAKSVDAADLKSATCNGCAGSSPAPGTIEGIESLMSVLTCTHTARLGRRQFRSSHRGGCVVISGVAQHRATKGPVRYGGIDLAGEIVTTDDAALLTKLSRPWSAK